MNLPTAKGQIIFVDSSVQNYQSLIQNIDSTQIFILNENLSGIEQITNALANQKDIEAVHILSHGSESSLKLGSDVLNGNDIENFNTQLKQWGNALTENGDILLYGCDAAAGETGKNFVKRLSELTGADVAASNDLTGNAAKGGDWDLEIVTGQIESAVPFDQEAMKDYEYTLANFNVTVVNDDGTGTVAGTLSKAILDANATAAVDDTITLNTNVLVTGGIQTLINSNIDFIGNNFSVDGGSAFRPFFVKSGTVNLSNMTVTNGRALGGSSRWGGGGAGMGGGLFIYNGTVGINNVTFSNNQAIGGKSSVAAEGQPGGNMGGGSFSSYSGFGMGTFGTGGTGSTVGTGGSFGGGGGDGSDPGTTGGAGGYGAGSGDGGGVGGNFSTGSPTGAYGGGGAGLGGAIFVRQGSLTLNNADFRSNTATGGTGTTNGEGKGGAVFVMQSLTNGNGNNLKMPLITLPAATGTNVFVGTANTAANGGGAATADNIYGPNIPFNSTLPNIAISSPAVAAATVAPGTTNNPFYELDLAVTSSNTVFTGLTVTTGGTYQTTDIATNGFKLS